jgi:hypothetical protein
VYRLGICREMGGTAYRKLSYGEIGIATRQIPTHSR